MIALEINFLMGWKYPRVLITEPNCLSMESSVKKIQASEERERRDGSANEPGDLLQLFTLDS